jgi:peptide/nickel transport system permease protein
LVLARGRLDFIMSKSIRYAVIFFLILSINFLIPRMMPGDPLENQFGEDYARLDPEFLDMLKEKYGLDSSLTEQFVDYLGTVITFDFGFSIHYDKDVTELIEKRLFWTTLIVVPSVLIGGFSALYLGSLVGYKNGGKLDRLLTSSTVFFYTLPSFLIAMMAVTIFSYHLDWFPLGHLTSGTTEGALYVFDVMWHLFLPITALALMEFAYKFVVIKNSVTQIMDENFILVARAKGLSDKEIVSKHVMRNIYPQFISMIALDLGFVITGDLVIEIVFSINGMGTLLYNSILARDYPVIQGVFIVLTIMVLLANFIADVLYGVLDPRIGDAKDIGVNR